MNKIIKSNNIAEALRNIALDLDDVHFFTSRSGPRNPKIVWNAEFRFTDLRGVSHHFLHTEDTFEGVVQKMFETLSSD